MLKFIFLFLGTYLIAAIPVGLLYARLKNVDIRAIGSGNYGATNIYRQFGMRAAAPVFLADFLKGWLPVVVAQWLTPAPLIHVGVGAVAIAGHSLPIYTGFKGGKGAATGLGVLLGLAPLIFVIVAVMAAVMIKVTRIVSLTTITACIVTPVLFFLFDTPRAYTVFVTLMALFVIWRHRENITRLRNGTENKV